jgi:hypothetical protein
VYGQTQWAGKIVDSLHAQPESQELTGFFKGYAANGNVDAAFRRDGLKMPASAGVLSGAYMETHG